MAQAAWTPGLAWPPQRARRLPAACCCSGFAPTPSANHYAGTCILFGDGCGAVLVSSAPDGTPCSLLGMDMHSDGSGQKSLNAIYSGSGGKPMQVGAGAWEACFGRAFALFHRLPASIRPTLRTVWVSLSPSPPCPRFPGWWCRQRSRQLLQHRDGGAGRVQVCRALGACGELGIQRGWWPVQNRTE